MNIYIYIYICTHIRLYIQAIVTCVDGRWDQLPPLVCSAPIYIYIYIYIYIHTYIYLFIFTFIFIFIYLFNREREMCVYIYIYICIHTHHIYVYIYIYTYIYNAGTEHGHRYLFSRVAPSEPRARPVFGMRSQRMANDQEMSNHKKHNI